MKYTHIISVLSILGTLAGGTGMAIAGTKDATREEKLATSCNPDTDPTCSKKVEKVGSTY